MSRFIKEPKEGFSIFLLMGFCIAIIFPSTGFSQRSGQTTQKVVGSVIPSNTNPNPGDQITVAINFDMTGMPPPNDYLGSFSGQLNWDPMVLSYVSFGGMLQGFVGVLNTPPADSGLFTLAAANPSGVTGVFDVVVITFDVVGPPGSSTALDLEITAMAAAFTFQNLLPFLTTNDGFVTVGPSTVNMPPQLTPIANQTMDENTTLDVPVSATDPDMDSITLSVNNLPTFGNFTDNGDGTGTISFAPTFGDAGTYPNIEVVAADDGTPSLSDTVSFTLTVNAVGQLQVVSSAIPSNSTPNSGDQITVAINFDMTGMPNPDSLLGNFTGTINWNPTVLSFVSHSGIIGFSGFVNTNQAGSGMITFNGANPLGVSGIFDVLVITFDVTGTLGDSTVLDLEYSAMSGAVTFHNLFPYLIVNDGMVTVMGAPLPNNPPQLAPITNQTMDENNMLDVPVSAMDPDMHDIVLSVNNLPAFGNFTDNGDGTGTISFAPTIGDAGTYPNIVVIAVDNGTSPLSDTVSFELTVNPMTPAQVISSAILSNSTPNSGDQITVAIKFNMTGMPGPDSLLGRFAGSIKWDPAVVSFVSSSGLLQGFIGVINAMLNDSMMAFNGENDLGVSGIFDVLVLTFDVVGAIGDSTVLDLEFSEIEAAFTFHDLLPYLTINDGMVTVMGAPAVNNPPQLAPIANQTMDENTTLDVPVIATDPDMDNLTLSVNNLPAFGSFTDNGDGMGTVSFAPAAGDSGLYSNIEVIVTDDGAPSLSDTVSFKLTVNPFAGAQIVSSAIPSNNTPNSGDQIAVAVNFDMTGMPNIDSLLGSFTGTISWDPAVLSFVSHSGIIGFTGVVNTNQADSGMITFNGANPLGVSGIFDVLIITFDVTGAPGTSTVLDLEYIAIAAAFTFHDIFPFLTVNDGMVTVISSTPNTPPQLIPIADQTMTEGETLNVPVSASDPDMDNITLSMENLPAFGNFTDNGDGTGTISFAPMIGDSGTYPNIKVIAVDNGMPPLSDTVSFELTVNPAATYQIISSAIPSNSTPHSGDQITVAINFDMTGMFVPENLLSAFTGTINWDPTILSFVSHSGILQGFVGVVNTSQAGSGMLTFNGANALGVSGIFNVLVITFDVAGAEGDSTVLDLEYSALSVAFTFHDMLPYLTVNDGMVTVISSTPNTPPQLTPIADKTMAEGETLHVPVSASDPDLDNITLSMGNLPAFGSFTDNGDGTGTISFAPMIGDSRTYPNIEVIAVDNGMPSLSDTVSFELTVNPAPTYQIISSAIPSNSTPYSGDQITVAINFDMTGMAGSPDTLLGSFTAILNWDPIVLSFVSFSGLLQGFIGATPPSIQAGSIAFNGVNPLGVSGIFDVLVITFDVAGAGGTSSVLDLEYPAMAAAITFHDLLPYLTVNDSMVTVNGVVPDIDPPTCALTNVIPGPPKAIEVTVQDTGSGLAQVNVASATNANVSIPPLTPGTTTAVVVVATKINQNHSSTVTLQVVDVAGNTTVCDPVYTTIAATIPDHYELKQNFPNPFNPSTTIHFSITENLEGVNNVSLKVFDLTGREIKTLINEAMQPGEYSVDWDATNNHGDKVAGGIYLYRLVAGDFTATNKMILMK